MSTANPAAPADYAGWLRALDDADLARLLATRPDLMHPVPPDLTVLAARASGRMSVELALDRLDAGALQVLEALAVPSEPVAPAEVARLLHLDVSAIEGPLDRLRDAGLVWDDAERGFRVVGGVRDLLPFPAGLGPPARVALAEIPAGQLPAVARDLGALLGRDVVPDAAGASAGASALVDALARAFESDADLDTVVRALAPLEQEVLQLLAAGPPIGRTSGGRRPVDAATAETPLRRLLAYGLLVAVDDVTVVLPREVALALRGGDAFASAVVEPPTLATTVHRLDSVDTAGAGQAFTVVRLVESLLEAWSVDPPPILRAGGLGVRELRRTARELDTDERFAALVAEVAHAAGLLAPDAESGESWVPTTGYDAWLAQPAARRWTVLAQAWLTTTRVPALVGRRPPVPDDAETARDRTPVPNALGPDVDRALAPIVRRDVVHALAGLPAGTAVDTESLVTAIAWRTPRRGGRLRDDLVRWSIEDAEFLGVAARQALTSFARALVGDGTGTGTADNTDDERDGAAERALEPLLPEPLDHILVQADLTAVAPGPLETALAQELRLLADVESTGGATVYRFNAGSIRRALDAGRSASDVHAFLAARSRTPIPQPLTYLVDDVARRHGRVRVGTVACYLRCDDDAVLSEISATRHADSLRLRRIAPGVLVSPVPADRVVERLRELGYAPAAENETGGVVVRRLDARRAPARLRAPRRPADFMSASTAVASAAVRALRAGDRAAAAHDNALRAGRTIGDSDTERGTGVPRSAAAETLSMLTDAARRGGALWIGYLNASGHATSRIVEPLRVGGGYVTAFDHRHDEVRTFAVHRITGVAELDDDEASEPSRDPAI
jgi:hypothetical protein